MCKWHYVVAVNMYKKFFFCLLLFRSAACFLHFWLTMLLENVNVTFVPLRVPQTGKLSKVYFLFFQLKGALDIVKRIVLLPFEIFEFSYWCRMSEKNFELGAK